MVEIFGACLVLSYGIKVLLIDREHNYLDILFLTNRPTKNSQAATVTEYLDSLHMYSSHKVFEVSMLHHFPAGLELDRFDAIITHYSLSIGPLIEHYLGKELISKLKKFKGLKAAFLQDEYREIKTYWQNINELGLDVLFSCVPEGEIGKVYPANQVPRLHVENVLTGYVSENLIKRSVPRIEERVIDVGYRTRRMPFWLGRLGYEKWWIAEEFKSQGSKFNLRLDLSAREGDRLYGDNWTKFVASCKAVIGVESGASIIDFDGGLERRVDEYVARKPHATFEEVFDQLLEPFEGSLRLHQISPRCFEAAALRTPMILFEGNYSGILKPHRHYIPLKKDFTNFDSVISKMKDNSYLQQLADRAYEEVACNKRWSYQSFVKQIDLVLDREWSARINCAAHLKYSNESFEIAVRSSVNYYIRRKITLFFQSLFLGLPILRRALFGVWNLLPFRAKRIMRPLARMVSR